MQVQKLQDEMFKLFHGDSTVPESIGYADHLLKGMGRFERLWDKEPLINNAASNAEMQLPFNLVMKDEFSRDGSKRLFVGSSFTPLSVKSTGMSCRTPIVGRTLLATAQRVLKNWKKALAFGKLFLLSDGTLPSGKREEDYDAYVLQSMFTLLKGRDAYDDPVISLDEDVDDADGEGIVANGERSGAATEAETQQGLLETNLETLLDSTEPVGNPLESESEVPVPPDATTVMPPDFIFQGFVAFKLFGPFAPGIYKSQLILTGDCEYEPGEKATAGRAASRASAAAEKSTARAAANAAAITNTLNSCDGDGGTSGRKPVYTNQKDIDRSNWYLSQE
jgi:hypothetical protein